MWESRIQRPSPQDAKTSDYISPPPPPKKVPFRSQLDAFDVVIFSLFPISSRALAPLTVTNPKFKVLLPASKEEEGPFDHEMIPLSFLGPRKKAKKVVFEMAGFSILTFSNNSAFFFTYRWTNNV